jgi:hypothetical protein
MRTVLAVALYSVLGACARFGGGEPDPFGIYDLVSINGETLPTTEVTEGWCELRTDGTEFCSFTIVGAPEPMSGTSSVTLGEFKDGCLSYQSADGEGSVWTGSICGETLTATNGEYTVVSNKRR